MPLPTPALAIASSAQNAGLELLFPGNRLTKPITDQAMHKTLNKMKEEGRPHGFRTSFTTWAQDNDVSWDVAETILGHSIGGKVERSYARSDLLERRRPVMQAWADYVAGERGSVVSIRQ